MTESQLVKDKVDQLGCESSSDLVVILYKTYKELLDEESLLKVDPIYRWEYTNKHDDWTYNVRHIASKLEKLDFDDYVEIENAYLFVLDRLLTVPSLATKFPMHEKDAIGWTLFKELKMKLEETRKQKAIYCYYKETGK
jgi:hypothetical protein